MAKHRYRTTEDNIARKLAEGRGEGTGSAYKPWLTIQEVSSQGRSTRIWGATSGRQHHFLSDNERDVFLELDRHDAVVDIREQFPLPRAATIAIARSMGKRHPQDHGIDIVMTTDLLIDVQKGPGRSLVAIAVKPAELLDNRRTLEKLEIERRHWADRGVAWRLVTDRDTSRLRTTALMWLHEYRWLDHLAVPYPDYWLDKCAAVRSALATAEHGTAGAFMAALDEAGGWPTGTALSAFRHLAANKIVGFDVDTPYDHAGPVSQLTLPVEAAEDRSAPNALAA